MTSIGLTSLVIALRIFVKILLTVSQCHVPSKTKLSVFLFDSSFTKKLLFFEKYSAAAGEFV